jgi:hypothetical protein
VPVRPYYDKRLVVSVVPKAVSEPKTLRSWVSIVCVDTSVYSSLVFIRNIFQVFLALFRFCTCGLICFYSIRVFRLGKLVIDFI